MSNLVQTFSDHVSYAQKAQTKAHQHSVGNTINLAFLGLVSLLIPTLAGVEFTLAFSVMDLMFGAELPSDPVPFQVYILSASAMVAVVALHVFIEKNPKNLAIRAIDMAAPFCLLFFFVGLLALYGSVDFHGLDGGASEPLSDAELFGEIVPTDETGSGWLDGLIGLGLGALVIVNVSVIHRLIAIIRDKLPPLMEKRSQLRGIIRSAKSILEHAKPCIDTQREVDRRKAVSAEDLALETSADIEAAVAPTMRKLAHLSRQNLPNRPATGGQAPIGSAALPFDPPAPDDVSAFMDAMEARLQSLPSKLVKLFQ